MGQIKNYSRFRKWGWWKKSSPRRPTIIFSINLTEFYNLNVFHYGFKIKSLTWTYHCRFQNLQPALFFSFFSFLFVYLSVFFSLFWNKKYIFWYNFDYAGGQVIKKIHLTYFRKQDYFFCLGFRDVYIEWSLSFDGIYCSYPFFYGSVIISQEHLKWSKCRGHCVY